MKLTDVQENKNALVAELADALALGASDENLRGSSPFWRT